MLARLQLALASALALVAVALGGILLFGGKGGQADALHIGSSGFAGSLRPDIPPQDFRLRDENGKWVSLSSFRGQPVILSFMYSTCRDTCPVTASQIRGAMDDLGHDVPALAVSVDPKNDTPENAKQFLLRQHVTGRIHFLLGTRAQLAPVWEAYGIRPQGQGYEHSAEVVLLDKEGRQRVGFPTDQLTPEGLAHDVQALSLRR